MIEPSRAQLFAEDDAARQCALDIRGSFLVQAPAGSGKTELLTQRYLALLCCVDEPGQIVALTFTRKAAGEMRERVLRALLEAERNDPLPDEEHARITRTLALEALAQDRRCGWALTQHPSRLRMQTFDALATALARRAPLAAGLGPHPGYVDDATALYRRAAENALIAARADDASWRLLLAHLDNDAARTAELVAGMLARRDQWLHEVTGTPRSVLRDGLERALRREIVEVLVETRRAFPAGVGAEIAACARRAADVVEANGDAAFASELRACADAGGLPPATIEALPLWYALARFLIVGKGTHFKQRLTRNDGVEPLGKEPGLAVRRQRKETMEALLRTLQAVPGLAGALTAASRMPEPRIGDEAWRIVQALLDVLPQAVGHLTMVFRAERRVDFVQANLAALDALGDGELPSDVLLQLDARVQHLLIDEFQDTSYVQLRLLQRLTAGWTAGDGRTLFAVGDPMQSIYRFREAEVAFFLQAQQAGHLAGVPLRVLRLRRNFRSQANLVEWCNATFAQVLGQVRDPARGVVPFEPAAAWRESLEGVHATVELVEDAAQEAARVVALIHEARAAGAKDIAVLVRARTHLAALLPLLRRERIAFTAIELDTLSQRQAVLDLVAVTHALLQPADRGAWLAVLRAPWCGLSLADLVAVSEAAGAHRCAPLPRAFEEPEAIAGVSDEGRARLHHALEALAPAIAARGEATVVERVRGAWLALGGPACLDDALDLHAAALFFDLLAAHERAGDVPDWDGFLASISSLHASPSAAAASGVQIMTMHKAKGLEFDTVILTGLAQEARKPDGTLLRWRRRDEGLLIAPAKSRGGDTDPVYRYLAELEANEDDAELGRLLYVACTRAKRRLHLVGAPATRVDKETGALAWNEPPAGSSLRKLWDAMPTPLPFVAARACEPGGAAPPPLRRLPLGAHLALADDAIESVAPTVQRDVVTPPFDWVRETTRRIGTLAHRMLARIAEDGVNAWPALRIAALEPRVRAELASAGFTSDELPAASARVLEAVQRTLADARGRWLFDPSHADARSEWALSGVDNGEIVRIVLDRTFVSDGVRWIVDFKTGSHEGGDARAFLDSEVERYRAQMTRYARMMRGLDPRPVRIALYYPFVADGFREIDAAPKQLSFL